MNRTLAILIAGTFTLSPICAEADDKTPSDYTPEMQVKLKKEADEEKAAAAKMTPEESAAAKKARDAERLKYETTIEDRVSGIGPTRNMNINKSAQASTGAPATDAERMQYENAIEDRVSGLGPARNTGLKRPAANSKADATPTPEAEKLPAQ